MTPVLDPIIWLALSISSLVGSLESLPLTQAQLSVPHGHYQLTTEPLDEGMGSGSMVYRAFSPIGPDSDIAADLGGEGEVGGLADPSPEDQPLYLPSPVTLSANGNLWLVQWPLSEDSNEMGSSLIDVGSFTQAYRSAFSSRQWVSHPVVVDQVETTVHIYRGDRVAVVRFDGGESMVIPLF